MRQLLFKVAPGRCKDSIKNRLIFYLPFYRCIYLDAICSQRSFSAYLSKRFLGFNCYQKKLICEKAELRITINFLITKSEEIYQLVILTFHLCLPCKVSEMKRKKGVCFLLIFTNYLSNKGSMKGGYSLIAYCYK